MKHTCETVEPLIAAYALGSLDPEEARLVDAHLASCPDCARALQDYALVAEGLLLSVPARQPRPAVRAKLIARISAAGERAAFDAPRFLQRLWPLAVVAAFVLLLGLNLSNSLRLRTMARAQAALAQQVSEDQASIALASYPSAHAALVRGSGAYGTYLYEPQLRIAVLYAWGLPPLEPDETYQLWLIEPDGDRVSGGIFQASEGGDFTRLVTQAPQEMDAYVGIGVTVEPAGGSDAPTGERILGADL